MPLRVSESQVHEALVTVWGISSARQTTASQRDCSILTILEPLLLAELLISVGLSGFVAVLMMLHLVYSSVVKKYILTRCDDTHYMESLRCI